MVQEHTKAELWDLYALSSSLETLTVLNMNIHHWDRKPGVIRKNLLLNNTKSWFWGSSGQQCDRQRYHHFFKYLSPRVAQRTQTSDGENRRKRRQWCHHSTQCSTHPTCSAGLPHCTFEHREKYSWRVTISTSHRSSAAPEDDLEKEILDFYGKLPRTFWSHLISERQWVRKTI